MTFQEWWEARVRGSFNSDSPILRRVAEAAWQASARVGHSRSEATQKVCEVCGGRAMACKVLGHRPESDRHVRWQGESLDDLLDQLVFAGEAHTRCCGAAEEKESLKSIEALKQQIRARIGGIW